MLFNNTSADMASGITSSLSDKTIGPLMAQTLV